jgi:hypothetical protein
MNGCLRRLFCCISCTAASAVGAPTEYHDRLEAAGPILWYSMGSSAGNEPNRGTLGATHDATYNGTVARGVSTFAGDSAAGFDGADDFMESLGFSPLNGNPSMTVEAVIRLESGGDAALWGPFLHWGQGSTGREVYFSVSNNLNTRPYVGVYNAGLRTTQGVPADAWIHLAWQRRGGSASNSGSRLFVNGVSVPLEVDPLLTILNAGQIDVISTVFRVNRAADFIGTRRFDGALDEIALFDRRLSTTEIRLNAAASGLDVLSVCPGDASGDGVVNFDDLNIVLTEFSLQGPGFDGDFDLSGVVDFVDLNTVLSGFGVDCTD